MISKTYTKLYCRDDVKNIKNYELAVADTTQIWVCHHWNEQWFTPEELKKIGRYWSVPSSELVFMTRSEHNAWHAKYGADRFKRFDTIHKKCVGQKRSAEFCALQSKIHKGKVISEAQRKHHSEVMKGRPNWKKGMTFNKETKTWERKNVQER